jgi:hypothetical protein
MPGVTLPSAGSSTKKVDIGPRRLRRAQRRFQRPGTGIRRCRDSNPGAGNPGSVPSLGISCAIPLRERVCCGSGPEGVDPSRPVSARRIRATLQRGCSERGGQSPVTDA